MPTSDKAMLFDIQRGSFVDGPGIRTTVFFKGCNLNCTWCHNPEGISRKKQLMFYKEKCINCDKCAEVCEHLHCVLCERCVDICPVNALKICGMEYDVESLLKTVKADKLFYDNSGGGVTCSGGEPMLQIDFLELFLQECKKAGIHTAIDTAGNVPWEYFQRILMYTDLFLYDIKAMDSELHKKLTGSGNRLILRNFERLISVCFEKTLVRVPVIPNANDGEIHKITAYLKERNIKAEFLPYHSMGESKRRAISNKPMCYNGNILV